LIWSIYFIFSNGKLYVHWPRLVPLEFAPDVRALKGDKMAALEKGEVLKRKRELSVSASGGVTGMLRGVFGRYVPGRGGGEEVEFVTVGKEGRAHAE
jgi:hypothetical protein